MEPIRDGFAVVDEGSSTTTAGDRFVRLAASVGPMTPTRELLLTDDRWIAPEYPVWHRDCGGPTPDVGVYRLEDALYHPRGMVMRDALRVRTAPELMPAYWRIAIEEGRVRSVDAPWRTRTLHEPAIACITPGLRSYGHILLEVLPRLWLAKRHLGAAFDEHRILIDTQVAPWRAMMRDAIGIRDAQFLPLATTRRMLRVRHLVVPGMLHDDFRWHPLANAFFDGLAEVAPRETPTVFAIARPPGLPSQERANRRHTGNADEIARRLARRGIPSIAPETLAFAEQVALFRRATLVIGEYGSALHTAIVSSPETRVLSLGFSNDLQSKLSALRNQRIGYLKPATESVRDGVTWSTYDPDLLDGAIDHLLDCRASFSTTTSS